MIGMGAKSITIVRAVTADFFFDCRAAEVLSDKINDVQLPQSDEVKYLGLHLDRRLTWHKHIFTNWKQLGLTLT
jgi:hypothetical protein